MGVPEVSCYTCDWSVLEAGLFLQGVSWLLARQLKACVRSLPSGGFHLCRMLMTPLIWIPAVGVPPDPAKARWKLWRCMGSQGENSVGRIRVGNATPKNA